MALIIHYWDIRGETDRDLLSYSDYLTYCGDMVHGSYVRHPMNEEAYQVSCEACILMKFERKANASNSKRV